MEWTQAGLAPGLSLSAVRCHGHPRPHQPSAVEHDPDRLAALGLVLAGDGAAAPRRGRPADVAQVVALAVLAQALEVAAQAPLLRAAQLQVDLAAAGEEDLLLLAGAQGRVDAHRLRERRSGPALGQPQRRAVAHIEPARLPVAALFGLHAVAQLGGHAGKGGQPVRCRLGDQRRRQIVHQPALDDHPALVFNRQLDLGLAVEGRSVGPGAAGGQFGRGGQAQAIEQREEQHQRIPGQHRVGQPSIPEARNQPDEAQPAAGRCSAA